MKSVLFILFLLLVLSVKAEEQFIPELKNLFESDLVVDASFKSQGKEYFYIVVNEVIKDQGYGIKPGDQIKLGREDNGCGQIVDFAFFSRSRFYLKKHLNAWALNHGSTQSIQSIYSFGDIRADDRTCGLSFVAPHGSEMESMNRIIREFLEVYEYKPEKNEYLPRLDSAKLSHMAEKNPMVEAFERRGRCCLGDGIEEVIELEKEPISLPKKTPELIACGFLQEEPKPPFSEDEFRKFLLENENPLHEMGVEGKLVLQLSLSESGLVSEVEVKRSLHPILDSLAVRKALEMPAWQAAQDQSGKSRSCYTMLPFRYTIQEER